jgi:tight adherence protein B
MTGLLLATMASAGVMLLVWPPRAAGGSRTAPAGRARRWLRQVGIGHVHPAEFLGVTAALGMGGALTGYAIFGGFLPALGIGVFLAGLPLTAYRRRRQRRFDASAEAWPALIEEMRVLTGSAGESIPRALLDVGRRGPDVLRPAFDVADREWRVSTDFAATIDVLKRELQSATADAVGETLLVANELGAVDLDARLACLAEDRRQDLRARNEAEARQAGVRFARRFVIIVPAGMAFAGMSLGNGRAAYQTPIGQMLVVAAVAMVAMCWIWSARLLRLPEERRVFP